MRQPSTPGTGLFWKRLRTVARGLVWPASILLGSSLSAQTIDTHNHLFFFHPTVNGGEKFHQSAAAEAVSAMDGNGISEMIIMPPPFAPSNSPFTYDLEDMKQIRDLDPDRFRFLAGGGSLNPLIQQAVAAGETTENAKSQFRSKAEEILDAGAVGFGEMTALHLCLSETHIFEAAPPDHPLFLLLAEIAAEHDVPIDIHMEAVPGPATMATPARVLAACAANPTSLPPNLDAFKRLLNHTDGQGRSAKIIWAHVGWDNLGARTASLTDELLGAFSNLYLGIKVVMDSPMEVTAPGTRLVDQNGDLKTEWLALFEKYPDRFMIGSDQFFVAPEIDWRFPSSVRETNAILGQIASLASEALKDQIAHENARRVFNLEAAPGEALSKDEEKCQQAVSKEVGVFVFKKAKELFQCDKNARAGKQPAADCTPPFGGDTAADIADLDGKARDKITRKCIDPETRGKDACPECYAAGNCATFRDTEVDLVEAAVDALVPAIFCDDSASTDGLTADEATCRQEMIKNGGKFAFKKGKCLAKCRKNESKGKTTGSCAAGAVADADTIACIAKETEKLIDKLDRKCADPPECVSAAFPAPLGVSFAGAFELMVDGFDPRIFCSD